MGRSALRKFGFLLLLATALGLPLVADPAPLERTALTLIALVALIKGTIIATSKPDWQTPGRRIWQILTPFDARLTQRIAPGADLATLARMLIAAAVAALTMWYALEFLDLPRRFLLWAQLACALVFAYSLMEFTAALIRALHRLAGIDVPPLQRDPVLSCSVSEFWGERWNLPITRWLNEFFFRPLTRAGHPMSGIALAFVVSTALHAWLFFAAIGWKGALSSSLFFLVQIPALVIERRLLVRQWPTIARRAWTLGFLLLTSPLFVWPLVRGLEMQLASR